MPKVYLVANAASDSYNLPFKDRIVGGYFDRDEAAKRLVEIRGLFEEDERLYVEHWKDYLSVARKWLEESGLASLSFTIAEAAKHRVALERINFLSSLDDEKRYYYRTDEIKEVVSLLRSEFAIRKPIPRWPKPVEYQAPEGSIYDYKIVELEVV